MREPKNKSPRSWLNVIGSWHRGKKHKAAASAEPPARRHIPGGLSREEEYEEERVQALYGGYMSDCGDRG